MLVAPDPGRTRLRAALRAVLGVGAAVTSSYLVGHTLPGAIVGGLAALLALFTVADAGVRAQAVTTVLLPVVGAPVLALATALHTVPWARDAAFLAVVGAGVYARRWGARGNALGIFAFMAFFMAQFLRAVPGQLPALYAAMATGLIASAAVRFGAWCYERRQPPPVVLTPPGGRGLARVTTRQAVQATLACAFALGAGQLVSQQRWYWAVVTAWWIFVNTSSRGETLVRGFRRVLGTVTGIVAGLVVAVPLNGAPVPTLALVAACVFGIFYAAPVSYSWMMFAVTSMAGLLYGLLGVLTPDLLVLRLTETGVGALGAALAVALVLPVTTHATTDAWIRRTLHAVRDATVAAGSAQPLHPHIARLDLLLGRVRLTLAPLVHPLSPLRARKARARRVLALLDDCARQVRGLAGAVAEHAAGHDEVLVAACARVETAVLRLLAPHEAADAAHHPAGAPAVDHPALVHLHGLEAALRELHAPLNAAPRPALAA
ncbi:FUSC family protein [Streptantibioticus cattleyicolor]|nr:FUSC family protein [Streptomyces sp. SID5468]CCB73587.1 putative membrane protein [Streptantibioticus cattleyicolor NRRL 8057 = DSM 46488]